MKKYLIIGYYGNANFGDEVMLQALLEKLNYKENFITVTSGDFPIKYQNVEYFPMHSIMANNSISKLKRVYKVLLNTRKIIQEVDKIFIGGGTLIKNNTGSNILLLLITLIAKLKRKRVEFISIGIENLNFINSQISKIIFFLANSIGVRDKNSFSFIKKVNFTPDLAIEKFSNIKLNKNRKTSIIAPALFNGENLEEKTNEYISFFKKLNIIRPILIVSQSLNKNSDLQLCKNIYQRIDSQVVVLKNFDDVRDFSYYGTVISERYHIGILSCFIDSSLILVGRSNKIRTLAEELEVDCYSNLEETKLTFKKPQIRGILE